MYSLTYYILFLQTLDLMKLDMANFTIEMYKPLLIANSIEYEKNKFKEYLAIQPGKFILYQVILSIQVRGLFKK